MGRPLPQVQESVANCLPPLVPAIKEDAGGMIQRLIQQLLESDKYAERKGAAYGLAGLVKGLGILSLKQQEMMAALTDAIQDKKNFRRREGEYLQARPLPPPRPGCLRREPGISSPAKGWRRVVCSCELFLPATPVWPGRPCF